MEQHRREERGRLEKGVVKLLLKKDKVIRNKVARSKCVVIFRHVEKDQAIRNVTEKVEQRNY